MKKEKKSEQSNKKTDSECLKRSIINTRNIIRKKFRDLHNQKQKLRRGIVETFDPIIKPLKSLADKKEKKYNQIKEEVKHEKDVFSPGDIFKTAIPAHRKNLFEIESKISPSEKVSNESNISGIDPMQTSDDENDDEDFENTHTDKIIRVAGSNSPKIDNIYGFRTHYGELYLGRVPIKTTTNGNSTYYLIKTKSFKVTPGLTNLLLMKNPKNYNRNDLETYREMLLLTHAHKNHFAYHGSIRRDNSSVKYRDIISQLFPEKDEKSKSNRKQPTKHYLSSVKTRSQRETQGSSLRKPQTKYKIASKNGTFNYTYWDDPNELVSRLRLLLASRNAGHTGHTNEIISIIEELREAKVIK